MSILNRQQKIPERSACSTRICGTSGREDRSGRVAGRLPVELTLLLDLVDAEVELRVPIGRLHSKMHDGSIMYKITQ